MWVHFLTRQIEPLGDTDVPISTEENQYPDYTTILQEIEQSPTHFSADSDIL
jgi:hypothetical protein